MSDDFVKCLAKVLESEGGFSNNPKDPGGATMKGVTQRVYDVYRKRNGLATASVRNISNAELTNIYRSNYWNEIHGDDLQKGVSYVVFDGAVNSGPSQSAKWLQRALNVDDDGKIGPKTLAAAKKVKNVASLINDICDQRLEFLKDLPTWGTFGKGWAARVENVRALGKKWATE